MNTNTGSSAIVAGTAGTAAAIGAGNILPILGFGAAGVQAGSIAAGVQSVVYGAMVPAGSIFATLQSWGATGAMAGVLGVAALPVGALVGIGTYVVMNSLAPAAHQVDEGANNNDEDDDDDDDDDGKVGVSVAAQEKEAEGRVNVGVAA